MSSYPRGADQYSKFLQQNNSVSVLNEPEPPFIPELELQALWFGGELGCRFSGTAGESVEIRDFGHWNHAAGPDFTEVSVAIDGKIHTGDLEIDLSCRSWEEHGHGANIEFNNVVLHLFLNPSSVPYFTRDSQHRQITQVQLPRLMLNHARVRELPEAHPGRCLPVLKTMTDDSITTLLESAAQYRLRKKASRIQAMAKATSSNQALYQLVSEALGFRKNRLQMILLAQRNPIKDLLKQSASYREARLFGCTGFIDDPPTQPAKLPNDVSTYLRGIWHEWWKLRAELELHESRRIPWVLNGSRPLNHPQRRIGALAAIVNDWKSLQSIWKDPQDNLVSQWLKACSQLSHPFWDFHYTLSSLVSEKPIKLVGQGRARDMLGNVIFPYIISQDSEHWSIYQDMRASDTNQKVRRASLRLFGENTKLQKKYTRFYYQQQGLLQIFQDFCLADESGCKDCRFPEQLSQWRGAKKPAISRSLYAKDSIS